MEIGPGDLDDVNVVSLLREHMADMHANSPPGSVHALDVDSLKHPSVSFWIARDKNAVLGCVALKELSPTHGEVKSMRTSERARNRGVASELLTYLIRVARERRYERLSLETGTMEFFEPARSLYRKFGFTRCGPFADYTADSNSTFMTRRIGTRRPA